MSIPTVLGADEVYTSTWFAFKVLQLVLDRNETRTTQDTISSSLSIQLLPVQRPLLSTVFSNFITNLLYRPIASSWSICQR
jgi:hypothetical protein